jgi:sugar lactone lactonase YvrE
MSTRRAIGSPEIVHRFWGAMPTGVAVSRTGRIFVNFPRWEDGLAASVVEIVDGLEVPFPDTATNAFPGDGFLCVQSVVVDSADRLWVLDTGMGASGVAPGRARLTCFDLAANAPSQTILFPPEVVPPDSYTNDVRFDLARERAFVTDSSAKGALLAVDLATGKSWRRLADHPSTRADPSFVPFVEGEALLVRSQNQPPAPFRVGADSLALSGERVFYSPQCSRRLWSLAVEVLGDPAATDADVARTLIDHGEKPASDGLEADAEGRIYVTAYEHDAVVRRDADGAFRTIVSSPEILWPDSLSLAHDGHLYFTANQLQRSPRFHGGEDRRQKPYLLLRVAVDGRPRG